MSGTILSTGISRRLRRAAKPPAPPPAAQHRESHIADPVLLFRYSALTFNGHRIHYDRDYVTKVEGYPGLIFHGPMQAAFQVELAAKLHGGTAPKKFTYRGVQPLFEGEFSVNANETGCRDGNVDREFGRPADDEGHRDVVSTHRHCERSYCRVGKGALAPCPPTFAAASDRWARFALHHPTEY